MKTIFDIAKAELKQLFYSPIAWLVIILFTFQTASQFTDLIYSFARGSVTTGGMLRGGLTTSLFPSVFGGIYPQVLGLLGLYMPLLTMGMMSKELNSGTIKFLYCSPIKNSQIIMGKFFSVLFFGLILIGILAIYMTYAALSIKNLDVPLALSGLMGIFFLICTYASMGIFMSSLTSYQIVAAILTMSVLGLLNMVVGLLPDIMVLREVKWWLAMGGRTREFMDGLLCSEDIIYFIMITIFFLYLTVVRLRSVREGFSRKKTFSRYMAALAVLILVGFICSRPSLRWFYDTTHTKTNTLTAESQRVIKALDGGLTVTTYVNVLHPSFSHVFPTQQNNIIDKYRRYTRFKPETNYRFIYYYDNINDLVLAPETVEEMRRQMVERCRISRLDTTMFLDPHAKRAMIDLSEEQDRAVVVFERENGAKALVRTFDDQEFFPSEQEITAGMRGLFEKVPVMAFLTGNGQRDINNIGDQGYNVFAAMKNYRNSLLNQGFSVSECTLVEEVGEEVDIIVIADMRSPLTEVQQQNLDKFIERGGNLLVLGEVNRQAIMNPLIANLGVKFLDGELVRPNQNYVPNLMVTKVTSKSAELSGYLGALTTGGVITMPGCVGIESFEDKGFEVFPVIVSDDDVWSELETIDMIENEVVFNESAGEVKTQYVTALALRRMVGKKEQKIMIVGDADCFANSELQRSRKGLPAFNFNMINGTFNWMSDGCSPVDMTRPALQDNAITYDRAEAKSVKLILNWLLPMVTFLFALIIWVRRRGR